MIKRMPDEHHSVPVVSVIVPARNEEACLADCLDSLLTQTRVDFEIIVVDDGSTDSTRKIADYRLVPIIDAAPLAAGCSGKCNAAQTGANAAHGEWLLFTDADTIHLPGSLARAIQEAREYGVDMLSYSPAQEVHGFIENAVMPVIYSELACAYRPSDVCDPASSVAAANGQYLLIKREAYDAVGGHDAVAHTLLEDVALAQAVKRSGRKIRFRFGGDAVRTRMYRTWPDLRDGWTKNLALLFPHSRELAKKRAAEFGWLAGSASLAITGAAKKQRALTLAGIAASVATFTPFLRRIRRAHFGLLATALAPLGLPLFVYLLLRSQLHYKEGTVLWKGRTYRPTTETAQMGENDRPVEDREFAPSGDSNAVELRAKS